MGRFYGFLRMSVLPLSLVFGLACDRTSPKARIRKIAQVVTAADQAAEKELTAAGLHVPPPPLEILTGGNLGVSLAVRLSIQNGELTGCQMGYQAALGSLNGLVGHYSACLGECVPVPLPVDPPALVPPGSEREAEAVRQKLTESQARHLKAVVAIFSKAYFEIQALGPFKPPAGTSLAKGMADPVHAPEPALLQVTCNRTELPGFASIWTYHGFPSDKPGQFAWGPDGTLWVVPNFYLGPTEAFRFREGQLLSRFSISLGHLVGVWPNAEGLLCLATRAWQRGDPEQPPSALTQLDFVGRVAWSKPLTSAVWNDTSIRASSDSPTPYAAFRLRVVGRDTNLFLLHPDGRGTLIPLPGDCQFVEWLLGSDPQTFVVLHQDDGRLGLYRIQDRLIPLATWRPKGSLDGYFRLGEDGCIYCAENQVGSDHMVWRFTEKGRESAFQVPQETFGWFGANFMVTRTGTLVVANPSVGLLLLDPGAKAPRVVSLPKQVPNWSRFTPLSPGRFVLDGERPSGTFSLVEMH